MAWRIRTRQVLPAALALIASCAVAQTALAAPPANDDFADAEFVRELPVLDRGSVLEATREAGEPEHAGQAVGPSVWYRIVPARSGRLSVNTCSARFDTVLSVYTGRSVGALTEVASDDDSCGSQLGSHVVFQAEARVVYSIAVGVYPGTDLGDGLFEFVGTRVRRPVNDNFGSPRSIRLGDRLVLSSERATAQRGEPRHFRTSRPAHSVWFHFRAPRTGRVTAATFGSSFDTVLAVYRGSRLSRLRRIASNDDTGGSFASLVRFRARRGLTYRIAVDGLDGLSGDVVLALSR